MLNRAIQKHGSYIHFLARISFMVPHPLLTYALSVTDISVKQFIDGNHSCLPLSFFYIYIGSSAASLTDTLSGKGSIWYKAEIYYFIISLALMCYMIKFIWQIVAKEIERFEHEFEEENPRFNLELATRQAERGVID